MLFLCSHLCTSVGDRIPWVTGRLVTLELPHGLHYCPVLQAAPEKSLGHLCIMFQTNTRSHCKLGIAFKQMHPAGIWSNVGVCHSLSHRALPRIVWMYLVLWFQVHASLAEWKLTLQRCLWASLHTIFSNRSGDKRDYKCQSVLWRRASLGLQGLLAQDLLWANMARLFIRCSWQWKQGSCVQH